MVVGMSSVNGMQTLSLSLCFIFTAIRDHTLSHYPRYVIKLRSFRTIRA